MTTAISSANKIKMEIQNPLLVIEDKPIKDSISVVNPEDVIHREFHLLHPAFRNKIVKLFIEAKKEGIDLFISETYRTPERQNRFLRERVTKLNGGNSKHQYGLAVDLIPVINGESQANNKEVLKKVGIIGEKLGLTWGGRWRTLYDPVHFEWTCKIRDIKSGNLPAIPDTLIVPSLNFFILNKRNSE